MSDAARPRRRPAPALLLILLLAAALRWVEPGLVEFKYDEANITALALGVAYGGNLPLLSGGTTLGIPRGPLDVYLVAAPLAVFGGRIEAGVWWLGALGVLAVALTYVLAAHIAGRRAGLLAALFMAANPWLVAYDRKLWAHIQVLFSVLLLLLAWEVVVRRRGRAAYWFPLLAALQGLAHVLALVQALSWAGAFLAAPRRWLRRETLGGIAGAVVLLLPYAWALLRSWGGGQHTVGNEGVALAASLAAFAQGVRVALREGFYLASGAGFHRVAGLPASSSPWWLGAAVLALPVVLLMVGGIIRAAGWARKGQRQAGGRLLIAWTVGPVIALGCGLVPVATQYWTALLPLPALYLALGLDGLARWRRLIPSGVHRWKAQHAAAAILATVVGAVWAGSFAALLDLVGRGAGGAAFGIPLSRWQDTLAVTREWAARLDTDEVRVAVNGVDPASGSEPAVVALLLGSPPWARFVAPQSPSALLLEHDRPSLYLWAVEDPGTTALLARAGELVWEMPLGEGHAPAQLYRLPAAEEADLGIPVTPLTPEPVFDAGLALAGYALPPEIRAKQEVVVTLLWRVLDPPPEVRQRDFTAFNHVLNAWGERVVQVDGLAMLSRDWWPGDVLVQRYRVAVPAPGTYTWRTGLYSRTDGGRSQLLSGGDAVDIGPWVVQ